MTPRRVAAGAATLGLLGTFGLGGAASTADQAAQDQSTRVLRYTTAQIRFEVNATAGDGGVQMKLDGEGWQVSRIYAPNGQLLLRVRADGAVGRMGVTELFFESAEPSFDVLPLRQLLQRFPAGTYRIEGTSADGVAMRAVARLTHAIPGRPIVVTPSEGAITDESSTVIDWNPVTRPAGIDIKGYEVIVEREAPDRSLDLFLPKWTTKVRIPPEFLQPGTDYKFEVLAIERSGNQTITEGEFSTAP